MKAAARDANEPSIVEGLREDGNLVQTLFQGDGVPDLLVATKIKRTLVLFEVKDPDKPPSRRKLTPEQVKWHKVWGTSLLFVIETLEEAREIIAKIDRARGLHAVMGTGCDKCFACADCQLRGRQ